MLIGCETVVEFVTTILYSGRVKDAHPVSAILIASPELGKTSTTSSVVIDAKCKNAVCLTDVTGRGLMELCKMRPEVSHFVLNDLVTVMSHKQNVNRYTLSIINAMTEEGIAATAWPGHIETFANGRRAIIACVTPSMMNDQRQWWNRSGLASRMVPFFYDHAERLTMKIKDAIDADEPKRKAKTTRTVSIPEKPVTVSISTEIASLIRKISDARAKRLGDPKGYRRLKQYRTLARSHALARTRKHCAVTRADIDWLEDIDKFVSYNEARVL